jgi:hypothetical protein
MERRADHEQLNGVWHLIRAVGARAKGEGSIDQCSVPYPDGENHRSAHQWAQSHPPRSPAISQHSRVTKEQDVRVTAICKRGEKS